MKLLAGDFGLGWAVEVDGNDSGWLEEDVVVTGLLRLKNNIFKNYKHVCWLQLLCTNVANSHFFPKCKRLY